MTATTTVRKKRSAAAGVSTSPRSRRGSREPTASSIRPAATIPAIQPRLTAPELRQTEEELLEKYEGRIRGLAHRLMPRLLPSITVDDLMQVGRIALIRVARRFDPARGVPIGGYLQPRLRGAMLDLLEIEHSRFYSAQRDGQWDGSLARRTHPARLEADEDDVQTNDMSVMAQAPDLTACLPDEAAGQRELARLLRRIARSVLDEREMQILNAVFALGMTLKDAGGTLGLGESRACQLRAEILAKLKQRLGSFGIRSSSDAIF